MQNYLKKYPKSYLNAIISSYFLMGAHMLAQIILTPLYLKILGDEQFGLLMIFLAKQINVF